ncbi:MAG: hypothetical protein KJ052_03770 [Candidatus Hydrogenedentes bacterium]|nr:hypothetical protein [Candidatus Hydrogenedentota bacterium]
MSYYRRRWQRRPRKNEDARKSAVNLSASISLELVRSEFFSFEPETFDRFARFYATKYGMGAEKYLRKTYPGWRSGTIRMAGHTEARILGCVPRFIQPDKQFELLSYQIPAVLRQQRDAFKAKGVRMSEMESTFRNIAECIINQEYVLDWFVSEVFPPSEVTEFLNVFKFSILDCLRQAYSEVRKDLIVLRDILPVLDASIDVTYNIALLDCPLDIDVYPPPGESLLQLQMLEPKLITKFRQQYRKILLDHAINHGGVEKLSHNCRQIAYADLLSVVNHLRGLAAEEEYKSTFQVQGHGGTLTLEIQKKSIHRMKYAMLRASVNLAAASLAVVLVVLFLCVTRLWFVLIYFWFVPIGILWAYWETLNEIRKEISEYERKRTAWIRTTRH